MFECLKKFWYTENDITGWIAVERGPKIPHRLETTPLKIKTDSNLDSWHYVRVFLYTAAREYAGEVNFYFSYILKYQVEYCNYSYIEFPSTPPSEVNKIWTITKLPGPRLTVQCNEVTVVDTLLSNDTCAYSYWNKYWSRKVELIYFSYYGDSASDEYFGMIPGNLLTIFGMIITCLSADSYTKI